MAQPITGEPVTDPKAGKGKTKAKRENVTHTLPIPDALWTEMEQVAERTGVGMSKIRSMVADHVWSLHTANAKSVQDIVKAALFG